jgi:Putative binding domain, N-terminal/Viral BACON domain
MSARPQRSLHVASLLWCVTLACLASACGSSSISVTSPGGAKCSVAVTNSMSSAPAAGANGTLTIATNRDCTWSASTTTPWISITSSGNGQGEATVSYRVAPNADPSPRHGVVTVNDATVDVTQEAAPCSFTVTPSVATSPAAGGSVEIAVGASSPACAWTAASSSAWITVSAGSSGSGNGKVTLSILPNGGAAREGRALVAGEQVTINQAAAASEMPTPMPLPTPEPSPTPTTCTYTLDPPAQTIAAGGGSGTIAISAGSGCTWTATPTAPWITITSGASGTGNGTVQFTVSANSGAVRSATLTIAGRTFTVTQAAGSSCSYSIAPGRQSIGAPGGTGTVAVTTANGCSWSATANASWLTITSAASGSGSGSITFSAAPNTGAARTGTLTIAGETFTVEQESGSCTFSLSAASSNAPAGGTNGSVSVTTQPGCTWSAASNAGWIAVTSGMMGYTGNGTVSFTVAANSGAARSGTLTIAGRTFTVNQEGASCSFSISPAGQDVAAGGGTGSVAVTTSGGCAWTAVSNAGWITVTGGASGSGAGSVSFNVAANTGASRSGTLTVAGQTFTITQQGASCAFSIAPTSQNVSAAGGGGSVSVTTGENCSWTATSNAAWIIVTRGTAGTGNGSVAMIVAPNVGSARTGTVTIAGQTFTVTQSGF